MSKKRTRAKKKPQPPKNGIHRPLTDLSLAELEISLAATIEAAGADSSSADMLRQAIAAKQAKSAPKPKAKAPKAPKPPPAPKQPPGPIPVGKLGLRKDPRVYAKEVRRTPLLHKRIVGLDLGNNCGVSYCDIVPACPVKLAPIIMGQWDLSLGNYDSGPMRIVRLWQFLEVLQPDLVMLEDVLYTPAAEGFGPHPTIHAIVARVSTALEMFGALKAAVAAWCELRSIPCQGISIQHIKQYATGKGNANKVDMINAANARFGVTLSTEDYEKTGTDNVVDSAFICAMGVDQYSEGLTGESVWLGVGGPPADGRAAGPGLSEPAPASDCPAEQPDIAVAESGSTDPGESDDEFGIDSDLSPS